MWTPKNFSVSVNRTCKFDTFINMPTIFMQWNYKWKLIYNFVIKYPVCNFIYLYIYV